MICRFRSQSGAALAAICGFLLFSCGVATAGQSPSSPADASTQVKPQSAQQPDPGAVDPTSNAVASTSEGADQLTAGTITGTVLDATGAVVSGARVKLAPVGQSLARQTMTDNNGQFSFSNVPAGTFQLTATLPGFETQTASGTLAPGHTFIVPPITMPLAAVVTQVEVEPQEEVAQHQIEQQEKQRVLGVVPNFYVSYVPDAAPLNARQKFQLAWKSTIDPFNFAITAGIAGIEQGANYLSGYGPGFGGYAKRYGASYADGAVGTFMGSAVFPALLRQDPRYFYKGTGTVRSRLLYAVANAFICKGDNKRWQPNYSNILGNIAAGGISNLYYPEQNRNDAAVTFESALIGIGATAAGNIIEEFVARKFTPNLPGDRSDKESKLGTLSRILLPEGQ
ncbi:MAG TPA: carboxypeptidase regulatory-like domain-containing protein [Candidatus Baltobacteraceae bacterium]|nr:carboxypeptidase regulatory-like domain-containing protein [Candidatus Baltobacteraceae bacterium]HTZ72362.1 carboxypeptidase regulatory-like domain-containing protein [Candidatus Aquilonibacter sp.]